MTISLKHQKTVTIADPTQADLDLAIANGQYPSGTVLADIALGSDFNAEHTLTMATNRLLGRGTAGTGAVEEITLSGLTLTTGTLSVDAASDTVAGKVELADLTETNAGSSATLAVTPDGLAGSYAGTAAVNIPVTAVTANVATGDGKAYITIPEKCNGMNLVKATASVAAAGTTGATTIQIRNATQAADMLSGVISIASGGTAATPGTIDTANDDVATDDQIYVDVDSVSTTPPQGLMVILEFRIP